MYWNKLVLLLLAIGTTALCCGTGGTPYQTIVPQQVIDDAKTLFPEQKPPHSSIVSGDVLFTFNQTSNVNITFVWEGAGYRNTFGYFVLKQNPTLVTVFPDVTWSNQGGCLTTGSSIAISRNFTAGESIAFWVRADGYNNPNGNIWYSVHGMNGLSNSDGYRHTAWVRTGDKVLIGFEDLNNLGDGDYNDVMFYVTIDGTLSNNNDIPTYNNGTIEVCEGGQIVDYLEINCTQYALLSGVDTSSCQGYLSIPTGWEVAPDDQQSRNIIDTYGSRLNSDCIALLGGNGYRPDTLEGCATDVIKNFTQDTGCITSGCSAQVLLRGKTKVSSCNGIENQQCDPTVKAKLLKTVPSTTVGTDALPLFPQSASVYLCCEAQLNLDVEIRKPVSPKVDIMLLIDTRGLSLERIQTIANDMGTIYDRLKSANIYPSIGVAVWSGALTIKTVLTSQKAVLASSLNGVGTTSNTLDVSEGIPILMSSNVGWRSGSHRLVVVLSAMPTFTAAINRIRQSSMDNLAAVDVLTPSSYMSTASTFVSNLPNGRAARIANDLRDWITRLSELVQLHAHEIKFTLVSDDAGVITQLPSTFSTSSTGTIDTEIELSYNVDITEVSATVIVWGYGLLSIDAVTNRSPSIVGETSFVVSFNETLAYSLTITDPDKNQVNVKYLSFVPSSASGWFDAPSTYTPDTRASVTAPEDFFGNVSAIVRLSDGCIETDTKLNFKVLKNPNFPPTTFNYALVTAEDEPVSVDIEARDFEDDTTTVTVIISQISLLAADGVFETEDGQAIQVGTVLSYPRRVTFRPAQDKFSDPITNPLASIKYRAVDSQGASSVEKTTTVIVVPRNDPPTLTGPVELWMDEDSTLHIPLDVWISDIDSLPAAIRMTVQRPDRGDVLLCGTVDCQTLVNNEVNPVVPQPIFFRSVPDEFGNNYTVLRITLSDGLNQTDASITIHVRPINDVPIIHPFFNVLPEVVSFDEDTTQRFDFNVTDIDSDLRSVIVTLNSQVPTSGKWEACIDSACNDRILLSTRSEIPAYTVGKYAMMLTPAPNVYDALSFTKLVLGARDAEGGYARPAYANIRVLPINDPPVIQSTLGDTISITSSDTALLNLGFLSFSDIDSGRKAVNVTIKLTGPSPSFVIPTDTRFTKACQVDDSLLTCFDAVTVISDLWIKQVFVNVSAQSFVDVTIDDLGHTDKWDRPLNDTKRFTINVREDTGIVTTTVDDVSLAIGLSISLAASVGAVVGLTMWLRKRYAGVSEGYFESLTEKIVDSNQNPLYVATNLEGANPLYRAE
jgi:Domain of unknown function (DUF4114)